MQTHPLPVLARMLLQVGLHVLRAVTQAPALALWPLALRMPPLRGGRPQAGEGLFS